jgi:outer membrane protein OmpA-like peptidoglycan-associated protein
MPTSRILMGLLPIGLLLSACASHSDQSSQVVPTDSSGQKSVFTDGFAALQNGDNLKARRDLEESYRANPGDPYEEENLAAAYQNTGELGKALPLYRDVIATGDDDQTMFTTRPEVAGMSLGDIARWNLKLAGVDEYGNLLQPSQAAALQSPSSQYEVYFDFNRADLSAEAEAVVRTAAKSAMAGNLAQIAVVGHTDTVGSDGYNQKLSERRAKAVEDALVADGVPSGTIAARGVGKADLMVPTPDGVREPKNRRVEITAAEAHTD